MIPVFERAQKIHALDRTVIVKGILNFYRTENTLSLLYKNQSVWAVTIREITAFYSRNYMEFVCTYCGQLEVF
jgi:hypothetical protein